MLFHMKWFKLKLWHHQRLLIFSFIVAAHQWVLTIVSLICIFIFILFAVRSFINYSQQIQASFSSCQHLVSMTPNRSES